VWRVGEVLESPTREEVWGSHDGGLGFPVVCMGAPGLPNPLGLPLSPILAHLWQLLNVEGREQGKAEKTSDMPPYRAGQGGWASNLKVKVEIGTAIPISGRRHGGQQYRGYLT
jgi:hypothetical protein